MEYWFVGGCIAIIAIQLAQSWYNSRKTSSFLQVLVESTAKIVADTLEKQPKNGDFEAVERLAHLERRMETLEVDCKTWLARANTRFTRAKKMMGEFDEDESEPDIEITPQIMQQINGSPPQPDEIPNGALSIEEIRELANRRR